MELIKHRRLLVRNSLAELEAGYLQMKKVGFEVDPDFQVETTVQQALMDIHNERKPITCGIVVYLEQGQTIAFTDEGEPFIKNGPGKEK